MSSSSGSIQCPSFHRIADQKAVIYHSLPPHLLRTPLVLHWGLLARESRETVTHCRAWRDTDEPGGPWRNRHPINSICAEQGARPAWAGGLWWTGNTQIWRRALELITNISPPRTDVESKVSKMCWEKSSCQTSRTMAMHAGSWQGGHCNPQLLEM